MTKFLAYRTQTGDKGQRFQIKYSAHVDAIDDDTY